MNSSQLLQQCPAYLVSLTFIIFVMGGRSFVCNQFKCQISRFKYQTDLFDTYMGPYQVVSLWVSIDLGAMAMKGYSAFCKTPGLPELHYKVVKCYISGPTLVRFYTCTEMQSVFTAAAGDWAIFHHNIETLSNNIPITTIYSLVDKTPLIPRS